MRAVIDLLTCDRHGCRVVVSLDQPSENRRTRDVAAFTDVDEQVVGPDVAGLETRQPATHGNLGDRARGMLRHGVSKRADVVGRRPTTAANHVDEAAGGELTDNLRHVVGRLIVFAELVRQSGVWVSADARIGNARQFGEVRPQFGGAERAVEPDHERLDMADRIPERLGCLARERAARRVGNRARYHDGQLDVRGAEGALEAHDRGFRIERIEDRLDEQEIDAALDQRRRRNFVSNGQFVEGDIAESGVVDVG